MAYIAWQVRERAVKSWTPRVSRTIMRMSMGKELSSGMGVIQVTKEN